jgi:putative hydrolase of the HAD superfamily
MRKPNSDIYEFVLNENNLIPQETVFIDDTEENTAAAKLLGMQVWNLIPGKDDVANLFKHKHFSN